MKLQTQLNLPGEEIIARILEAAVNNVDPYRLVDQNILLLNETLCIEGKQYPGPKFIILVAMGKASLAMTQAAVDKLGPRIRRGVCVCKTLPEEPPYWDNVQVIQGAHPVPDERSLHAGEAIRRLITGLTSDDLVLVLVSGGSSALVVDPCEGIGLDDLQAMNQLLLQCGATINEMNCVRKHVERLKGGGLIKLAYPAQIAALLLSDVIGDDMSVIASGPTVADPTTYADALGIVSKYSIADQLPACILAHLEKGSQGQASETLKPNDPVSQNASNTLIGSNHRAIQAAMEVAIQQGFNCHCVSERMTGEASEAAKWFLNQALNCPQPVDRPTMTIAGGETTVTVRGNGKGGRNLQVALAAVERMSELQNAVFVTLATDGEDGPTDAAGAVVTSATKQRAQALGLGPTAYLKNNDAYTFFERVDGLIKTGSTGTNVNDLTFLFQFQQNC